MDRDDIQNTSQSGMDIGTWSRTLEALAGSGVTHYLLGPGKSQGFRAELGSQGWAEPLGDSGNRKAAIYPPEWKGVNTLISGTALLLSAGSILSSPL